MTDPDGILSSSSNENLSRPDFEAELETALADAGSISSSGRWDWLNMPFTIWLLSTVAVGLVAFSFSNYSACRVAQQNDNERLVRIVDEIKFRAVNLTVHMPQSGAIPKPKNLTLDEIHSAFDPDVNYGFVEFKGMWSDQLSMELTRLLVKWRIPFREQVNKIQPTDELAERAKVLGDLLDVAQVLLTSRSIVAVTSKGSKPDDATSIYEQVARVAQTIETVMTEQVYSTIALDFDGVVIAPSVCVRRSLWPF